MEEEEITNEKLLDTIHELFQNRDRYISAMKSSNQQDSIDTIIDLIESVARA